ncbi:MAG TPA: TonB-dependent receptor plug domain-containing protein, partial [Opitutus sp.]|nr:TonB-dependent receptor plug domain-containing protein [Opitutus sp.]
MTLSPFEVVSDNRGYYGANTMSGTRFNTKIEDLASAVTIVTKEQMTDFAMLDINDVFLYTVGAEGTGTYTDIVVDRNGSVSDNVQLNPTQANRVRGLASANVAFNNIEMQNRTPIDPVMIDALEVSRGPNASVFGLGNPSGTVNQVGASANLLRDRYQVQLRGDDWGGYRETVDVNQVILPEKLALRFSQVFNHEEWERKPSGVDTERYNVMVKYRPFKNTTITGGYYYYHMYGNRPNAIPPRDGISYWRDSGAPTWDPVSREITLNGQVLTRPNGSTAWGATNGNYDGPTDALSSGWLGGTHSQVFINENGAITHWTGPTGVSGIGTPQPPNGPNPSGPGVQPNRYLQPTPMAGLGNASTGKGAQALFLTVPSITDRSIFDWKNINISAPNRIWDKSEISTLQLDQIFLNTPRQTLAAQFTFLREESERYQRNFIGIANDLGLSGLLTIDVNERLLDGANNPYFLRPYISTSKPRTTYSPWKWDTYRGQAAYKFDFTQERNLLRHLGIHQLTGYYEYKYRVNRNYSYRDVMTSNNPWITPGVYRGNQSQVANTPTLIATTQSNFRYYVGDNQGYNA